MWWCYALWLLEPLIRVTFVQTSVGIALDSAALRSPETWRSLVDHPAWRSLLVAFAFLPCVLLDLSVRRLPAWRQSRVRAFAAIPAATTAFIAALLGIRVTWESEPALAAFVALACVVPVLGTLAVSSTARQLDRWTLRDARAAGRKVRVAWFSERPWIRMLLVGLPIVAIGGGKLRWIVSATIAIGLVEFRAALIAFRRWIRA